LADASAHSDIRSDTLDCQRENQSGKNNSAELAVFCAWMSSRIHMNAGDGGNVKIFRKTIARCMGESGVIRVAIFFAVITNFGFRFALGEARSSLRERVP
jgi:hypothetical protein